MKLEIPVKYFEMIIPPRCRNPRRMNFETTLSVVVDETTFDEFPLVASDGRTEYRIFQDRFFANIKSNSYFKQGKKSFPKKFDTKIWQFNYRSYTEFPLDETERRVKKHFKQFLLVDGQIWYETGEPKWVINTFGLGHNHGGTGIFVECSYNPNISNERYFRLDEKEKVLEKALLTAKNRGDNESLKSIRSRVKKVKIIAPEYLLANPVEEHGEGDPFINCLERIIDASDGTTDAGAMLLAVTISKVMS
jgi:hypothetical protein